jgi:neutral trehalase/trehalose/maltose hydrolase-like predicted phosphorylase
MNAFAILPWLALLTMPVFGATDPTFTLEASAADFGRYFPSYLANGYFSSMTAPRGTEGNLAYMVAFMDYANDDIARPAAIPGWTEIDYSAGDSAVGHFWMNQAPLRPESFEDYRQTLNLHEATLTTSYRYVDHQRSTQIKVITFVSQAAPHLAASQIALTPDFDGTVQLSFALNLWAPYEPRLPLAQLSGDEMQEAVAAHDMSLTAIPPATPDRAPLWYRGDTHVLHMGGDARDLTLQLDGRAERGLKMGEAAAIALSDNVEATDIGLRESPYRLALNLDVKVVKGETYVFTKFIAASREGWGEDGQADRELAVIARGRGFDALLAEHRAAWLDLWKADIAIDGDARAQTAVHSDLYYLLATSTADTHWPMGACGLTPGYAGHAFWDNDLWIFPALLLLHPERAKSLVAFRAHTLPAAQARAHARGLEGAMYPWEADPENGTEQTPHFAAVLGEREIHVNADIAIAQWQYWLASHDRDYLEHDAWPVIRNIADFWVSRATWNAALRRYEILHVTSVAENYTDVPNDTYTNVSAQTALRIATTAAGLVGERPDARWAEVASTLFIPFSQTEQRHLDFDPSVPRDPSEGSTLSLLMYPSLDAPMTPQVRRNDYDYTRIAFKQGKPEPHGMGAAPASIAAAAVGDADSAVAWLQSNFTSNLIKPPFNVRTETPTNNTGYFVTASGGYLQTLIYGFSGLRVEEQGLVAAYAPVLPRGWRSLTLKHLSFRGQYYDFMVDRDRLGRVALHPTPDSPAPLPPLPESASVPLPLPASGSVSAPPSPRALFKDLFDAVQDAQVFADSKTFADAVPTSTPEEILARFHAAQPIGREALKRFVEENFSLPSQANGAELPAGPLNITQHIDALWDVLTRSSSTAPPYSSLLPLPEPYVVPGGRFRELYYWDSYFTMLGLAQSGRHDLVEHMVHDFAFLIDTYGHVPNGTRSYYLSRSQPPFFYAMLGLLEPGDPAAADAHYLPELRKEYAFWMQGEAGLRRGTAHRRVVAMPDGAVLNRYWDDADTPREESFREDTELARTSGRVPRELYRNLRAAAESGWDFSSRWFADGRKLAAIDTTEIVPIDLNSLLYGLEQAIGAGCARARDARCVVEFTRRAAARRRAVNRYLWNAPLGVYHDYRWTQRRQVPRISAATLYPLFADLADQSQAAAVAATVSRDLLKDGGVVTTPWVSGQQWDAPNGWAPLQWIAVAGLRRYSLSALAERIACRWIRNVDRVYGESGKLVEKYDVTATGRPGGGGEYPTQDGFGWTNGVMRELMAHSATDGGTTAQGCGTPAGVVP